MAKPKQKDGQPYKYFDDQFDDEEVMYVFRKHPFVMRKGLIYGMLAWLVGPLYTTIMTYTPNPPSMNFFFASFFASIILGMIIFFPSWINWYFSVYIVTNQRLIQIKQKGLFSRAVSGLGLHQIQSINYEIKGLQETLLGFGTIEMQTYFGDMVIKDVHKPAKTQKRLLSILREEGVEANEMPLQRKELPNPIHD